MMSLHRLQTGFLPVTLFLLWGGALAAPLHAQQQERGLLDRINKPDLSQGYTPAQKQWEGFGAAQNKTFTGRSFASVKAAPAKNFRSKDYAESKQFRTRLFATSDRRDVAARGEFAGRDRAFRSRAVEVSEARGVRKALPVRPAVAPGEAPRPFLGRGKRQGDLDEQSRDRKPLTVEEVRELLNKSR